MKKTGFLIVLLFVIAALFCGCGKTADGSASKGNTYYSDSSENADSIKEESQSAKTSEQITQNRKIIEYISLTVETKTFDKLMDNIDASVKQSGGYIENSKIEGNSYYGTDKRTAELKIRIPKSKQSDFSDFISKNCNVVNRSVDTDDVTERYIDTQSRIKALNLEKETLEKLLSQSSNVSDTITVYEKLTEVIAEIESYESKLKQMDNLIDYTTFTIYISEVEKETSGKNQNWFVRTWNGLVDNLSDVGKGSLNFLSFMIAALPYWLLLGIIAFVVTLIIRRHRKKRNKAAYGKAEDK